ncbi:ATP-dependent DNA helicase [Jeotgalibaca sp. PTS2502]|uniref:DEAD/DEAH box helicase n=1 Tax=Jeotgalibaca sp. PTS2502 TaxID=1903686 RepID=UPI000973AEAD|nr:DEAD/DEAH box helicase family protein [Jeotgalibaca sp. PTS2502]APZ49433.1 ATP-dependent DNA helicase [Jeotgalibaca sp. PTS2502]
MEQQLYGRAILQTEWQGDQVILDQIAIKTAAFQKTTSGWQCQRCGTNQQKFLISGPCHCGDHCFYCSQCLAMGKIKRCSFLYGLEEKNDFIIDHLPLLKWEGSLSAEQERASGDCLRSYNKKERRLIWAVAGAGKTEMIFQVIARCLTEKGRVCIASPRIDVCLELYPRFKAAFPYTPIVLLHGQIEEDYQYSSFVIATTHQLLRFQSAFDLLVIDEVDSFPYHNNAMLNFATEKAVKASGCLLYLTATPPQKMQRMVQNKQLAATILPGRYHGYPLVEAHCVWVGDWRKAIRQKKGGTCLKLIDRHLKSSRRFILFLPHIQLMLELEKQLKEAYPDKRFSSVSSEDPKRIEKVEAMRAEAYNCLLSTTILERGVTFRDIDVLVLGAEDAVFTESSLVQIAGRVGRHKDYPSGSVCFAHYGYTKAMKRACKQIKQMNQRAQEGGLLHGELLDV